MWSDDKIKKTHMIHTVVAKEFLGHIPDGHTVTIDHINNNQMDNSVKNLQLISSRENTLKDLKLGRANARGISWSYPANKWVARISINNKKFVIGYYQNIQDAAIAYKKTIIDLKQNIYPNYTGKKLSK
jgi:hypothetical protein